MQKSAQAIDCSDPPGDAPPALDSNPSIKCAFDDPIFSIQFVIGGTVFFAAGERRLAFSPEFERSREARAILTDVEAAVTEGLRDKQVLQRCPHLVLADKRYYHSHLKARCGAHSQTTHTRISDIPPSTPPSLVDSMAL